MALCSHYLLGTGIFCRVIVYPIPTGMYQQCMTDVLAVPVVWRSTYPCLTLLYKGRNACQLALIIDGDPFSDCSQQHSWQSECIYGTFIKDNKDMKMIYLFVSLIFHVAWLRTHQELL